MPSETDKDSSSDSPSDVPPPKKAPASANKAKVGPKDKPPPYRGPPVDKDGKPIPPPPIIGPDGKEKPRPKDAQGNPLPIYVTPEGAPIFNDKGDPIPLRFDKEGRPVPLEVPGGAPPSGVGGGAPGTGDAAQTENKVPDWILWVAFADIAGSLVLIGFLIFQLVVVSQANETSADNIDGSGRSIYVDDIHDRDALIADEDSAAQTTSEKWYLVSTLVIAILGAAFIILPIVAVKKSRPGFIGGWCAVCVLIVLVQGAICFTSRSVSTFVALGYCGIRLVLAICAAMMGCINDENNVPFQYGAGGGFIPPPGSGYYQGQGQGYPGQGRPISQAPAPVAPQQSNVSIVQQQPTTVTTTYMYPSAYAAMPAMGYPAMGYGYPSMGYGYGMGYPAMGGWGWGGGYYPHHHHHWDDFWW